MTYTLFPHQKKGAAFLAAEPGTKGLFFGMGTGKTVTSLEAVAQIARRKTMPRVLVIAPPIALPMWQKEAAAYLFMQHSEIAVQILYKTKADKEPIPADAKVLVLSYAVATARAIELRDWLEHGILICDESHALKNPEAKRTKAILGRGGIALGADYIWQLTGTPITRWNDDVFPFLCRADLQGMWDRVGKSQTGKGQLDRFKKKFTVQQQRQFPGARFPTWMTVGNQNTEELAEWIYDGGHALRVDLKEVFDSMPPLTTNRYTIPLDADAELKSMIKDMAKLSLADLQQKLKSKEPALATIRRRIGLAKVKAAAAEIAERVESGQNVLIGAWHTEVIDALHQELQGKRNYTCASLDGRSSITQKKQMQDAWNEGKIQCFIGQIGAMGVSLNLQHGGTQIVVVEEDWSPSIMDQFYARLWRYGQEKHVHVDTLVGDNKLEEAVGRISQTKAREHERFNAVGREAS